MAFILLSIINILQFLLFVRAVMSWFPDVSRSSIGLLIYNITEPMLSPVRNFLRKFDFFNSLPIDMSLLILYLGLSFISTFVYYI